MDVAGHFVWLSDGRGGYVCERRPIDYPWNRTPQEAVTSYDLSVAQMKWSLRALAQVYPAPDSMLWVCHGRVAY